MTEEDIQDDKTKTFGMVSILNPKLEMINIHNFVFNPWQENTYVIYGPSKECVIIDAGCLLESEEQKLYRFIVDNGLMVKHVLNTHLHIDHIFGNAFVQEKFNQTTKAHKDDLFLIEDSMCIAKQMRVELPNRPPDPEVFIDEPEIIECSDFKLNVLHVPGHTPGHLVYYLKEMDTLFTGDVLFHESIGRTDFPYGNHNRLVSGIQSKLMILPDDTKVYSGHGESTTIGHEKKANPFL